MRLDPRKGASESPEGLLGNRKPQDSGLTALTGA